VTAVVVTAAVLLVVLGIKAVSGTQYGNSGSNPVTSVSTSATPNQIAISNFAFAPNVITVPVGTTITWINQDAVTHSIKSADFVSTDLAQGQSFQHTFKTAGTFEYSCSIHPSMPGKIIVQ